MRNSLLFLLWALLALNISSGNPAQAGIITVDTLQDRSDRRVCSLRSAVAAAAADRPVDGCKGSEPGLDTIRFASHLNGTIALRSPLYIRSDVSIEGPGTDRLAIAEWTVAIETDGRAVVELSDLTMQTGLFIRYVRHVGLSRLRFESVYSQMSRASAIQVQGSLLGTVSSVAIDNCEFVGNRNSDSPVSVVGRLNRLTIESSTFLGNRADLAGALLLDSPGPMLARVEDSLFASNQAFGGLAGAIAAVGPVQLELARNHFRVNRGQESGALFIAGDRVQIENSVFNRNGSPYTGAIHIEQLSGNQGESQLLFSTLVDNDSAGFGPALVNRASVPLLLKGNLLRAGSASRLCGTGGLASLGFNLEILTDSCPLGNQGDINQVQMALFRINGPAPAQGAPVPDPNHPFAVDAVPASVCSAANGTLVDDDLLGRSRPMRFQTGQPGPFCDVGAVELLASDVLYPLP